jgi:nucleoside-diphosphate-sugar epimerase
MPKALVIAGTSFIGRHVCDHLRALGCEVVATSRRKEAADRGETVFCELTDPASVENAIRDAAPDWIIQCGGATSSRDPDELLRTHVDGTCNVLAAARVYAHDASVCIFGSAAEYGPVAERYLPVSEECVWQPTTPFGQSKLAQTHLALAAAASTRQKIVIVRPFNVVGPGLPDFYFAASLARRLLKLKADGAPPGTEFEVFNADSTRDFIDARDVAAAVAALLCRLDLAATDGSSVATGSIFNLATGIETSLIEVATLLGELAGGYAPKAAGEVESRGGIVRSVGDASRLRQVCLSSGEPWTPQFSWRESISDMWSAVVSQS